MTRTRLFYIGLLELTIPAVYQIYSSPIKIRVDDLLVIASPIGDRGYDKEKDERLARAHKRALLAKLDRLLRYHQGIRHSRV